METKSKKRRGKALDKTVCHMSPKSPSPTKNWPGGWDRVEDSKYPERKKGSKKRQTMEQANAWVRTEEASFSVDEVLSNEKAAWTRDIWLTSASKDSRHDRNNNKCRQRNTDTGPFYKKAHGTNRTPSHSFLSHGITKSKSISQQQEREVPSVGPAQRRRSE